VSAARARRPKLGAAIVALVLAGIVAALLQAEDANPAVSQTAVLTSLRADTEPGHDPSADVWGRAPESVVPLTAQETTAPFGGGSVPAVRVRSLHFRNRIYVRVEWDDTTKDVSTASVGQFADAVAVELPATPGSTVPAVCMGQANNGVNIWQWRADRQQARDWARAHPNRHVDQYQAAGDLAYPARRVGNLAAAARPAQDLVAQGFGTLGPAERQAVGGRGVHSGSETTGRWAVVFSRDFRAVSKQQPAFAVGGRTDVAFAVWNGMEGDRDGIKSVSAFAKLVVARSSVEPVPSDLWWFVLMPGLILGFGLLYWFLRSRWFNRAR